MSATTWLPSSKPRRFQQLLETSDLVFENYVQFLLIAPPADASARQSIALLELSVTMRSSGVVLLYAYDLIDPTARVTQHYAASLGSDIPYLGYQTHERRLSAPILLPTDRGLRLDILFDSIQSGSFLFVSGVWHYVDAYTVPESPAP